MIEELVALEKDLAEAKQKLEAFGDHAPWCEIEPVWGCDCGRDDLVNHVIWLERIIRIEREKLA